MATKLDREDVLRVAELSRLMLTDAEIETFATDLAAILEWAREVQQADTAGIEPTAGAWSASAWRDDRLEPSLDRADALDAAPDADRAHGLFRVPSVF